MDRSGLGGAGATASATDRPGLDGAGATASATDRPGLDGAGATGATLRKLSKEFKWLMCWIKISKKKGQQEKKKDKKGQQ
jgi:hypothetical protein